MPLIRSVTTAVAHCLRTCSVPVRTDAVKLTAGSLRPLERVPSVFYRSIASYSKGAGRTEVARMPITRPFDHEGFNVEGFFGVLAMAGLPFLASSDKGKALEEAELAKRLDSFVFRQDRRSAEILKEHPLYREMPAPFLAKALQKGLNISWNSDSKFFVEEIFAHPSSKDISSSALQDILNTAIRHLRGIRGCIVVERIVSHPNISPECLGMALQYALDNEDSYFVGKMLKHPKFKDVSSDYLGVLLSTAVDRGLVDITEQLISHPNYHDISPDHLGKVLRSVATREYKGRVSFQAIVNHPRFKEISSKDLSIALGLAVTVNNEDPVERK